MLNRDFRVERSNSRYMMFSAGRNRISVPLYWIIDTRTGEAIHMGKRKHVVEMWNTRYNLARPRSFYNS